MLTPIGMSAPCRVPGASPARRRPWLLNPIRLSSARSAGSRNSRGTGLPGCGCGGDRADLGEAESERAPRVESDAVLVEAGRQAKGTGESDTEHRAGQHRIVRAPAADSASGARPPSRSPAAAPRTPRCESARRAPGTSPAAPRRSSLQSRLVAWSSQSSCAATELVGYRQCTTEPASAPSRGIRPRSTTASTRTAGSRREAAAAGPTRSRRKGRCPNPSAAVRSQPSMRPAGVDQDLHTVPAGRRHVQRVRGVVEGQHIRLSHSWVTHLLHRYSGGQIVTNDDVGRRQ